MKRIVIACFFLASSHAIGQGIPTYDNARMVQDTLHYATVLNHWVSQYNQLVTQYEQLQATHNALSGVRNLGDVFDNPRLRKYLPADMRTAYAAFRNSGYEGLVRSGARILSENHIHDVCAKYDTAPMRKNCESTIAANAQTVGDLEDAYVVIEERSAQIKELQNQINQTKDPKAIAELQARISAELTDITNERTKLSVASDLAESRARLDDDRQNQINQRDLMKPRGFSVGLEIPSFVD